MRNRRQFWSTSSEPEPVFSVVATREERKYPYGAEGMEAREVSALLLLPLWQSRANLRDQIRGDAKTLARKAHKFLTLSAEYSERETFAKRRNGPWPTFICAMARPTRQSPCEPFESGKNCLPGMEAFAAQCIG